MIARRQLACVILLVVGLSLLTGCADAASTARSTLRQHAADYLSAAQTGIEVARSHEGTATPLEPAGFQFLNRDGETVRIKLPADRRWMSQDGVIEVERASGKYSALFTQTVGILGQGTWLLYSEADESVVRGDFDEVTPLKPSWYLVSDD